MSRLVYWFWRAWYELAYALRLPPWGKATTARPSKNPHILRRALFADPPITSDMLLKRWAENDKLNRELHRRVEVLERQVAQLSHQQEPPPCPVPWS